MSDGMIQLCNKFLEIESEIEDIENKIKDLKKAKELAEERLDAVGREVRESFIANDVPNLNIHGRLIYIHKQMWVKPKDKDHDRAIEALKNCGMQWLVQEKFDTRTVSSHVRECDDQDIELPPEFYEAFEVKDSFSTRSRKG
jgi:hypothetical protein